MTAKATFESVAHHLHTKSVASGAPSQTLLKFTWPGKARIKCEVHGVYVLNDGKSIQRHIHDRLFTCPACKEEHRDDCRETRKKSVPKSTLRGWIKRGGLALLSELPEQVVLSNTDLHLRCTLCDLKFHIPAFKFSTWNHNNSTQIGCRRCRTQRPLFYNHDEYLNALNNVHQGRIVPEFIFKPFRYKKGTKKWFRCNKGHRWMTRIGLPLKGYGCRYCAAEHNMRKRAHPLEVKEDGKVFHLDSKAELSLLKILVRRYGSRNVEREVSHFYVPFRGTEYYPDFFVKTTGTFFEVKGLATLGLKKYLRDVSLDDSHLRFEAHRRTFVSVLSRRLKIRLVVVDGDKVCLLPLDWVTWTRKEVEAFLRKKGCRL